MKKKSITILQLDVIILAIWFCRCYLQISTTCLRIRDEPILALESLRTSKVEQSCTWRIADIYKDESSNYLSLCYHFVDQNCYHNNYQLGDVLRDLPLGSRQNHVCNILSETSSLRFFITIFIIHHHHYHHKHQRDHRYCIEQDALLSG